jgi:hypothetical protein
MTLHSFPSGERPAKRVRLVSADTNLSSIGRDCLGVILDYLDTHNWIQFSYTCKDINELKRAKDLMIHKKRTLLHSIANTEAVLQSLTAATGTLFNVDFGRGVVLNPHIMWLSPGDQIDDRFLAPLSGTIHTLNISYCSLVTDQAFEHLKGIHTLEMRYCTQITDTAFEHLEGIRGLNMSNCTRITDKAFVHLKGIQHLIMNGCTQETITHRASEHLAGLHILSASGCKCVNDLFLENLRGIRVLAMSRCRNATDKGFAHLKGIHTLDMSFCHQETITDAAFEHLQGIHTLCMSHCMQHTITGEALAHLKGIHTLDMSHCSQTVITDAAFEHLAGVHSLDLRGCDQLTAGALNHVRGVGYLNIMLCETIIHSPEEAYDMLVEVDKLVAPIQTFLAVSKLRI